MAIFVDDKFHIFSRIFVEIPEDEPQQRDWSRLGSNRIGRWLCRQMTSNRPIGREMQAGSPLCHPQHWQLAHY